MEANQLIKTTKNTLLNLKSLTKMGLSISVVFSAIAGYLLAAPTINFGVLLNLIFGGYCMVGASNAFNQIIEKDLDALMERTKNRPIPSGKMSVRTAFIWAVLLTITGIVILFRINSLTAFYGALSIFLYTCLYTPLKPKTPLSVLAGAIPGAIPFMLGWVAVTNDFDIEPGILFAIQFFWQFPHFWAIGWFAYNDYEKAGFKMLPTLKRDKSTAVQIIMYSFWTVLVSILPFFSFTGSLQLSLSGLIAVLIIGIIMIYFAFELFRKQDKVSAKKMMLASVTYITLLQIIYIVDKFLQ